MKKSLFIIVCTLLLFNCHKKEEYNGTIINDTLSYHPIRVDQQGMILPWYSADLGKSYDTAISLVWNFWKNMEEDSNGVKYYLNHQVWRPNQDKRGIGGDQISMALSSWRLLYQYSGKQEVIDNMVYMADYYLAHSLSDSTDAWPSLPYPYNTNIHSGKYDGDMILGKDYTQPDKAGSFGYELVCMYKITGNKKYLDAAIKIAKTLASKVQDGDSTKSPLPFKVNAKTGQLGYLKTWENPSDHSNPSQYCTNWSGTLDLFEYLFKLDSKNAELYKTAFNNLLKWMIDYPVKNNRWGPFFEDIPGWSDCQINAVTFGQFILSHQNFFPNWPAQVKSISEWVYKTLANEDWKKYGVTAVCEQTAYKVPGNSHTSRQASFDLMFNEFIKDSAIRERAIHQLNWATYMVDSDGKNRYPKDDIWLTDGYGDYIRHYLRAMGALPELAPDDKNHLLSTSVIIQKIVYGTDIIYYFASENTHREVLRLTKKPTKVVVGGMHLNEVDCSCQMGWNWRKLKSGGVLTISTDSGNEVNVIFN